MRWATGLKGKLAESRTEVTSAERIRVLKQLAESQTPRIAAFEILAEDIRQGLSQQAKQPGPLTQPALPPELAKRISAYLKEKSHCGKYCRINLRNSGKA
jgi:hypothetical protein